MFQNYYLSNVSIVDGQAIMHKQKPREDHISTLHSMLMQRRLDVPRQLLKAYEQKVLLASKACRLQDQELTEVNQLLSKDRDNDEIKRRRIQIYKSKSEMKKEVFKQYQEEWASNQTAFEEDLRQENEQKLEDARGERFSIFGQLFPSRDRLACPLFSLLISDPPWRPDS